MKCSKWSCTNDATHFMIVWDSTRDMHPSVFPRCEGCLAGDKRMLRKHRLYGSDRVVSVRIPSNVSSRATADVPRREVPGCGMMSGSSDSDVV